MANVWILIVEQLINKPLHNHYRPNNVSFDSNTSTFMSVNVSVGSRVGLLEICVSVRVVVAQEGGDWLFWRQIEQYGS